MELTTEGLLAGFVLAVPILFCIVLIFIFSAKKERYDENCEDKL